jgi:FAD/FMN-containing dehydrogenase
MSALPPLPFADVLQTVRTIVGEAHVLTTGDLSRWEQEWRKREHGKALAVVRPANTEEVAQVVQACVAAGVSMVPQGGNTSLAVGSTPNASGTQVVLSLQRMNQIRSIDTANLTVTVEAGCILQTLQEYCAQAGYLFPLRMASEGSCTLGGNLGTNAGGTQVLRYGNTRELCLGLEVVNAQGQVWSGLTGLRKDNTGYDLRHLFIGSEGTLGVITAATMRLYPLPTVQLTAMAVVPSLQAAVDLLGLAHRYLSAGLTGFEVIGRFALGLVVKHFPQQQVPFYANSDAAADADAAQDGTSPEDAAPYYVVLEHSDFESEAHARTHLEQLLQAGIEQGCVQDAVVATSLAQSRALWHIRESIPLAQAQEGLNIKHDISIAVSSIPAFVQETDARIQAAFPGVRFVNYGHLGDGNLHYNVQAPLGSDAKVFLKDAEPAINTLVYDVVARFNGSISAEHGIGSLKRDKLTHHKSPVALGMMRAIKTALDPNNRMNPGRVLWP